ncbi:MAG: hypothetical protein IKO42_07440 [Opitutales bacterium]|nr:hypothetical protein [Opitutales bacterium]
MPNLTQKLQKFKDISVKLTLSERFGDALKICEAAIEMLDASAEKDSPEGIKWLGALESAKAGVFMAQKDFAKAKDAYCAALEHIAMLPRGVEFSVALDNLAKAFQGLGDAQNYISCKLAALENLEETAAASKGLVAKKYKSLAGEMEALGRSAEAIELRRKAQKIEEGGL